MTQNERERLYIAIENSRHLRGSRNITDLAFSEVEAQRDHIHNLLVSLGKRERELARLENTWCVRVTKWFKRAIS